MTDEKLDPGVLVIARKHLLIVGAVVAVALVLVVGGVGFLVWQQSKASHRSDQQNVSARYTGCVGNNALRRALRSDVWESKRQTPLLLKLFPQLDTAEIRELTLRSRKRKLEAFADYKCKDVALAAVPPDRRRDFHVP